MSRRKPNWREELVNYQITTKAGRLKFLVDVVKAYEQLYPVRFRFYLNQFKQLRKVLKPDGYTDAKGRKVWSDNIPTEPFMFVQRWIPNFGHDPDFPGDMEMLKKAWEDFVCSPNRRHLKHSTLWKGSINAASPKSHKLSHVQGGSEEGNTAHRVGNREGEPSEHSDLGDDDHEGRS